ncbi:multicopper oxidase family protein [Methylomagnum sp.]
MRSTTLRISLTRATILLAVGSSMIVSLMSAPASSPIKMADQATALPQAGKKGSRFQNPPEIASSDGVLTAIFTVTPAGFKVAGLNLTFPALYEAAYTPPVLRVNPGDRLRILLNNFGQVSTNLHFHGLNVTPREGGDNIFVSVDQGDSFQYDFPIPASHRQGLYWYHPHRDPFLNTQIAGGMAGGIIIGNILAPFPALAGIPERLILLKDLKARDGAPVDDPDPSGQTRRTVNGLYQPKLEMRPGQLEFWRIGNQSSNIFYRLKMDGQTFHVIGTDGNLQNQATPMTMLVLPPGARFEALVYGPPAGNYRLQDAAYSTGPEGDQYPGQRLMSVVSKGAAVTPIPIPSADQFPKLPDLRAGTINQRRTIVFSDTVLPDLFFINGKPFTPDCVDTLVRLGDVEEWTIQNTAREAHVFHIHQLDFQVTEMNGAAQPFNGYNDVVTLPPAPSDTQPSVVKVLIPFTDPVILGEFVYHCHIIQHEDQGMMSVIRVIDPAAPMPDIRMCQTTGK